MHDWIVWTVTVDGIIYSCHDIIISSQVVSMLMLFLLSVDRLAMVSMLVMMGRVAGMSLGIAIVVIAI
ncbi:hypothetical protein BDB01DRAFT_782370 [Pilobolus umbonatus]|nr:hypothetical protein BDB01DRAFT_782370 [Pilobolus umbonatus]